MNFQIIKIDRYNLKKKGISEENEIECKEYKKCKNCCLLDDDSLDSGSDIDNTLNKKRIRIKDENKENEKNVK